MKRTATALMAVLLLLCLTSCGFRRPEEWGDAAVLTPVAVGIPYHALPGNAAMPWDIRVFDGCVYVGGGDYDRNISPGTFRRYRISDGVWEECGEVPDEQISRFLTVGGRLTVPGIDPTGSWDWGNYYVLDGDAFRVVRTIPDGIHNFDLVEFDGKLFSGDGVSGGMSPVAVSEDGGASFTRIPLLRDGVPVDTSASEAVRAYDFVVLNGELYAIVLSNAVNDLYRYDGSSFVFESVWTGKVQRMRIGFFPITAKAVRNETLWFTNGYLYSTRDMETVTKTELGEMTVAVDLLARGDRIFVLAWRRAGKSFDNLIYEVGEDREPEIVAGFRAGTPVVSFDYANGRLWFGFGAFGHTDYMTGTVASAPAPECFLGE